MFKKLFISCLLAVTALSASAGGITDQPLTRLLVANYTDSSLNLKQKALRGKFQSKLPKQLAPGAAVEVFFNNKEVRNEWIGWFRVIAEDFATAEIQTGNEKFYPYVTITQVNNANAGYCLTVNHDSKRNNIALIFGDGACV